MRRKYVWLLISVALIWVALWNGVSAEPAETARTWTDTSGQFRVEAEFVGQQSGKVKLRRSDGKVIEVPLERLSEQDQTFVRETALAQKSEKKSPRANSESKSTKSSSKSAPAAVGEWPQWRGPNRDNVSAETGLLTSWPEEGPPVAWKINGIGNGYSSVAVTQGKVFTMGRFGRTEKIIALNDSDGSQIWATDAGAGSSNQGPNSTPTVDKDLVFGLTIDGDLACVEVESGRRVWQKSFSRDFGGQMMSGWGFSESVLVDGDRVICTPGNKDAMLVALDRRTGNLIWKTRLPEDVGPRGGDGAGYSSVVISHAAGVKQYVQLVGRGVIGVDAGTGELLWGFNDMANGTANIPTPIVKDDYVLCSTGYDGGTALLKLSGGRGQVAAQKVYVHAPNQTQNHHGGMILVGKNVYMGHGHNQGFPLCMEFLSGKDMWRQGRGPGGGSAAITYADGHIYFRYQDGTMALVEASPSAFKLKGKFRIGIHNSESWPQPVVAGGKLYLRDQGELICYDIRRH